MSLEHGSDDLFEIAYQQIFDTEKIFNFHNPKSELSLWNENPFRQPSPEFQSLLKMALWLREISAGSFTPYVDEQQGRPCASERLDFGGIAKGHAVDRAVEAIFSHDPEARGFIEAGGDIRYFGEASPTVQLRLGVPPKVYFRSIRLNQAAVATSAPFTASLYGQSKTALQCGRWPIGSSVTVVAKTCALADGLTKAGMFASSEILQKLSASEGASFFVFDSSGEAVAGVS